MRGENPLGYGIACFCSRCKAKLTVLNCKGYYGDGPRQFRGYHWVGPDDDDEGFHWRSFCDQCWDLVDGQGDDAILSTFESIPFVQCNSDKEVLMLPDDPSFPEGTAGTLYRRNSNE